MTFQLTTSQLHWALESDFDNSANANTTLGWAFGSQIKNWRKMEMIRQGGDSIGLINLLFTWLWVTGRRHLDAIFILGWPVSSVARWNMVAYKEEDGDDLLLSWIQAFELIWRLYAIRKWYECHKSSKPLHSSLHLHPPHLDACLPYLTRESVSQENILNDVRQIVLERQSRNILNI